jgi:hypothetical protein
MKEGTNRRKVQFQDFELVVKQNTEIRNQIGDIVLQARLKKNLAVGSLSLCPICIILIFVQACFVIVESHIEIELILFRTTAHGK